MVERRQSVYQELLKKLIHDLEGDEEAIKACQLLQEKVGSQCTSTDSINQLAIKDDHQLPIPQQLLTDPQAIAIFSDGACRGNPGPGSYGVIAQDGLGEIIFQESDFDIDTTNNIMELTAAIRGLELLIQFFEKENPDDDLTNRAIFLFSDSKYVVDGATTWMAGWKNRGWKKADKSAPLNLSLWQQLDQLLTKLSEVKWVWVKGHAGHPQNELCDQMANEILDSNGF